MKREGILDPRNLEDAKRWRMRGEEIRTLADEAHDAAVRAMMLGIAADCDRLAKDADERASLDATTPGAAADHGSPAEDTVQKVSPRS